MRTVLTALRNVKDEMTKLLSFLFIFAGITSAHAVEFKHFKLKNELKALNDATEMKRSDARFGALSAKAQESKLRDIVSQKLLNLDTSKNIGDEDTSPLFRKIAEFMEGTYQSIGQDQTDPLVLNHDIGGGVLNFSGFTWHKPLANFQLYVNRQLAKDVDTDDWIVHDSLYVAIDASTLLTNIKDENLMDISEDTIGAFAGISFVREYKYSHFAPTYLKGLVSDFSKLFLSFTKFNTNHVLNLDPYVFMKRKDKFTFNAGGMVSYPPTGGLSGRVGVLVSTAHERVVEIKSFGPEDNTPNDEFLMLGIETTKETSVGAHASLVADFFNILKITILSYDLEYDYAKSHTSNLYFYPKDRDLIENSKEHASEFKRLIKGRTDEILAFRKNIVSLEESINKKLSSKFGFLLFGSLKKKETEQVKIVKNGIEKVFHKHYAESVRFIQNLWSRIFGIVIHKIFDWDVGVKNAAEMKKKMAIEFEHMEDLGDAKVDGEDKFSVTLTQSFSAAKTHKWWHRKYRKETIKHLERLSNLEPKYKELVEDKKLRGPLEISNRIQIMAPGLTYFNELHELKAYEVFKDVCRKKNSCQKLLKRKYDDYISRFRSFGVIDIMRFKAFLGSFYKRIHHYSELYDLFGMENVFMNGQFNATQSNGANFTTFFKEGEFQGLGVIDTFIREGVNRAPANIQMN